MSLKVADLFDWYVVYRFDEMAASEWTFLQARQIVATEAVKKVSLGVVRLIISGDTYVLIVGGNDVAKSIRESLETIKEGGVKATLPYDILLKAAIQIAGLGKNKEIEIDRFYEERDIFRTL